VGPNILLKIFLSKTNNSLDVRCTYKYDPQHHALLCSELSNTQTLTQIMLIFSVLMGNLHSWLQTQTFSLLLPFSVCDTLFWHAERPTSCRTAFRVVFNYTSPSVNNRTRQAYIIIASVWSERSHTAHPTLRLCDPLLMWINSTDMRRLTTGIHSEKCVVRRFRRCANVIECTYTNLDSIAYCTPRLYDIAYCSKAKTRTACYCTEYCRQL